MRCRHSTAALLAATALALCSCSAQDHQNSGSPRGEPGDTSSPSISPSAAPGVAFNYDYQFSIPDKRIAAIQEAHASACENLGLARCRITGVTYSIDQNERVTAGLELKLDPSIARQFGKTAQQTVEGNSGKLVRLDIGSSDQGEAIAQASKQRADYSSQVAQLEQELAKTKPGTAARANLMSQIQQLQQLASEQSRSIETSQAVLATTPMAFHYYGEGGVPGFRGNPIRQAWVTFVTTVEWLVGILLQGLAVLVPLLLLLALFLALWRTRPMRAFRGWIKGPEESAA